MDCPKCNDVALVSTSGEAEAPPLTCPECKGIWMEADTVTRGLEAADEIPRQDKNTIPPRSPLDGEIGSCPHGHGAMVPARVNLDPSFHLERCPTCDGVWFDGGEWERLSTSHLLSHLSEFWTVAWQRKQRRTRSRDELLKWAKDRFGDELFAELSFVADLLRENSQRSDALAFLREESRSD